VLVVLAAAACGTRTLPYRFASPMLGQADVPSAADSATRPTAPSAPSTERPTSGRSDTGRPHAAYGWQADAQAGVRTVSAHGIEITMPTASADAAAAVTRDPYARPAAWSSLRAPHKDSDVTVTTVHGNDATIARAVERYNPHVESMEGAAFMYACLVHGVPFAQVRAVSNIVERRNRAGWKMHEAVEALGATVLEIIDQAGLP